MTKQRHIEEQYFGTAGVAVTPPLLTGVSSVLARTAHPPQTVCSLPPVSGRCSLVNCFAHPHHFQFSSLPIFLLPFFPQSPFSLRGQPSFLGMKEDYYYKVSHAGCGLLCITCEVRNFVHKCLRQNSTSC